MRITALRASVVHRPVAGVHSSASYTAPAGLLKPVSAVPPVTSTSPVGSSVAFICRRACAIEPEYVHVGLALFKSMISALLVGGSPPPAYTIFPGSYITADP